MSDLEKTSTENNFDKKTLENLLDTLVNIKQVYISRGDFEYKKSKGILEENGENELGKLYNLYLPQKMHEDDYLFIIKELNKHSFGDNLPEYASINELKIILLTKVDILIEKLNITFGDKKENDSIKIREYLSYYLKLFPEEKNKLLLNEKYKKFIIELKYIDKNNQCEFQTEQDLAEFSKELYIPKKPINVVEEFSDELIYKNIDEKVLKEFGDHFDEAFFEEGIENLRQNMMTFTQDDAKKLNLTEGKIEKRVKDEELDKKPRKLRDAIGIDNFKKELEKLRTGGNQEEINKKEIEASNTILNELYKYPYQATGNDYGYQPNKLNKYKEIYCVGFSLLGHAFLSELGIKHNSLDMPGHSALEIIIGGKKYFFDGANQKNIFEFYFGRKIGDFRKIELKLGRFLKDNYVYSGNVEKILLSQICNNKGQYLKFFGKDKEAMYMFNKAIELNPKFSASYNNIGEYLNFFGKNKEAINMFNKAIELNPKNTYVYYSKSIALDKLGKTKLSNLYLFTSKYLDGKKELIDMDILYREEKAKIRKLIKQEDFERLRLYLLSLEEK